MFFFDMRFQIIGLLLRFLVDLPICIECQGIEAASPDGKRSHELMVEIESRLASIVGAVEH